MVTNATKPIEQHLVLVRPGQRRPDREDAGDDRDDDRHHVVEQQRGGRDQTANAPRLSLLTM